MGDAYCGDCKRLTEVVSDHAAGDTVCSECGLVLEARSIDETSEWRTFANESGDHDPNRVGGPSNPLLADAGLYTVISGPRSDSLPSSLGRWQNRASNPERTLLSAFKTIASMADRLHLVGTIKAAVDPWEYGCLLLENMGMSCKDRANEIYKKVEDLKSVKGRNLNAILAACLYIACRQESNARTVKEICSVADGATKKELGRAKEYIIKQIGVDDPLQTVNAKEFVRRFCSHLGMSNHCVKAVHEVVQKSEELDIRRNPISLVAAVIYMVTQLSDDKKSLKDIATATQVAEGTLKNSYKDLYPHASMLIPTSFAKKEDLKSLCIP